MLKYIITLFICLFCCDLNTYSLEKDKYIKKSIEKLFEVYKKQDFKNGVIYTTGKMECFFRQAIQLHYKANFYVYLESFKIIAQASKKNFAEVSLLWISKLPNNTNPFYQDYRKIKHINYLLEYFKKDKMWKIKDAHFNNEYIIYNIHSLKDLINQIN